MSKIRSFPVGGTHLPENKGLTTGSPIRPVPSPSRVVIALRQHIGVACRPLVAPGDHVDADQVIGANDQGLSARVHASITGTVSAIEERTMADHSRVACVVIEGDPQHVDGAGEAGLPSPAVGGPDDPVPDGDAVRRCVEEAGIVGLGGAGFPTHVKLQASHDVAIDTVIINGAECEPYITTDDRLMQEWAPALFRGLEIIRRTVGAEQGIVACEINKPAAIERLRDEARNWPGLSAVRLGTRYPHGAEKHLIKAVLDREVPTRSLPMAVGVVVNNVQTAIVVAEAVDGRRPLTRRVLTVSGSAVASPANFLVPLGISLRDCVAAAGGASSPDCKLIVGGPMTGTLTEDWDLPVTKGTSGIVLLAAGELADRSAEPCIRCGSCVSVCPMYLQPNRITAFVRNDMLEEAEAFGVNDCILCGACAFVCPSHRPLLQWLREGKAASASARAHRR